MFRDLIDALALWRLSWKPDTLHWMGNNIAKGCAGGGRADLSIVDSRGDAWVLQHTDSLLCLGIALDPSGDSMHSVLHRLVAATRHWYLRRAQLCRRRVSLVARIKRFYQTVGKTLLWGCGGGN